MESNTSHRQRAQTQSRVAREPIPFGERAAYSPAEIYKQTWSTCSNPSVCYEVIRIRRREAFQIDGRFVEPAEVYPGSDAWGVDGFTHTDKDAAFAKLREVSAR